jgi:anaerobic selenocysteine-containing dehydrogenase
VSVDPYINETTRFANVILPPPPPSRTAHYDIAFYNFSVRNVARFSPAPVPLDPGVPDECEIVLRLAAALTAERPSTWDSLAEAELGRRLARVSAATGLDASAVRQELTGDSVAERELDLRLRAGPYGEGFGQSPAGVSLARLKEQRHGVDLGALEPRIPEILRTRSGRIELCPEPIVAEVRRLAFEAPLAADEFVIVGRRHLRSNNSWMHNVPALVKGRPLCTVLVNSGDAARLGLVDGGQALVSSRVGSAELTVETTDDIAPGVVSIPHGWGHGLPGSEMAVAAAHAGVNANRLTDDIAVDPLSGTAVLNGVPVSVKPLGSSGTPSVPPTRRAAPPEVVATP